MAKERIIKMNFLPAAIVQWLHLLAFTIWVGGISYVSLVLTPSLETLDASSQRKLMNVVSARFTKVTWVGIVTLLVTGIMKSAIKVPSLNELFTSPYGVVLLTKHLLLLVMIVLSIVIALTISPKLSLKTDAGTRMELSRASLKALKQLRKL